jgi:cellulose synthase/poly-beta-1,6-N-acetylglucosamine synthase-like glycosyltransferase/phosphoglycerol transferase MdoB-like AlkP superfamily enzyme
MNEVVLKIYEIIIWLYLIYSAGIFSVYSWIALFSYGAVLRYKHGNIYTDYSIIASNPNAPSFSLIAPAYNEGKTIVENVRSLLSIYYHKLEIIIVNDGSKDDTIDSLIEAYQLEKVSYIIPGNLPTKEVRNVYKSKNPAFKKLIIVDKVNGGKADALNVGINISKSDYIVCIDVDCIIEQDAILKLAKPFMEQTDKRLIACGGAIRLANNCRVENGKITEVNLPKSWLGRSQALEYIRAFVLGRMAWSRASGLILISGAFGAFDKEIVLEAGGYDPKTVGEDMELVVRMRRYMVEHKIPHRVITIPDPLCWTEVPEDTEILKKQRNRWMRGTMETLWKHRKLMFNPKYGKLGMISLPYWFFFEFLGPLVEFSGYIIFWIFVLLGLLNWQFFFALLALVLFSSVLYSTYAICVDLVSHQVYTKRKDLTKLIITAVIEPFYFHPIVTWAGIKGMKDYFGKNHAWGDMQRKGFDQQTDETFKETLIRRCKLLLNDFSPISSIYLIILFVISIIEWFVYNQNIDQFQGIGSLIALVCNNFLYGISYLLLFFLLYSLVSIINQVFAKFLVRFLAAIFLILQIVLAFYFTESRNLLGNDLFYYPWEELNNILKASGVLNWVNILMLCLGFFSIYYLIKKFSSKYIGNIKTAVSFLTLSLLAVVFLSSYGELKFGSKNDLLETAEKSKLGFFISSNLESLIDDYSDNLFENQTNISFGGLSDEYPFLFENKSKDILGQYFNKSNKAPNLVLIIVEGLGDAYSNPNGYIGDFTPFLSNLKDSSLVWENNLSSSGRTFAVLPTILGSLPFGNSGFLELPTYPNHFNLINVLAKNNFNTGFVYGGNADFDFMKKYLQKSGIEEIIDQSSFGSNYRKLPIVNGESWGFEDQAVMDKLIGLGGSDSKPYFNIALTLSSHNPFLINDEAKFADIFDKRVKTMKLNKSQRELILNNQKQLISIMNVDHAIEEFFQKYRKRPDFNETIFIITGDHSMPEIPLESKIDRYHVPLIVYSPLLKTKKKFDNIVSHFDITPTIMAYYKENYNLKVPAKVNWLGKGLDIGAKKNPIGIPIMQSKSQLVDFVVGNIHINDDSAFQIGSKLDEEPLNNQGEARNVFEKFDLFKSVNRQFNSKPVLMPDSVYQNFFNN